MKNIENYIFTGLFLSALFLYSGLSIWQSKGELLKTSQEIRKDLVDFGSEKKTLQQGKKEVSDSISEVLLQGIQKIENTIETGVYMRYDCIESYGILNRFMGKKEINGYSYALDRNGAYNSVNFWVNVNDHDNKYYAQQLSELRDATEKHGGHFIFMGFPNKYNRFWNSGFKGIPYNDYNDKMDELLVWNRRYGIDSIDFRETMKHSGLSFHEMFYKTDHHWTGYAAFLAFKELVNHMNVTYDQNLDPDGFYRDEKNYAIEWHKDIFIGASGRNVGIAFSGSEMEDFQTMKPNFSGNFTWNGNKGDFEDSVIQSDKLTYKNPYESDMYAYYLGGVYARDEIVNHDNPDGLKVFMIRDSFASPMIIDLLPMCSKIDCVWGKYATDEYVKEMVTTGDYDYVMVAYYTEDIMPNFFLFYKDEVEQKRDRMKKNNKKVME